MRTKNGEVRPEPKLRTQVTNSSSHKAQFPHSVSLLLALKTGIPSRSSTGIRQQ